MRNDDPLWTPEQVAALVTAFVVGMVFGALIAGLGIWVAIAR